MLSTHNGNDSLVLSKLESNRHRSSLSFFFFTILLNQINDDLMCIVSMYMCLDIHRTTTIRDMKREGDKLKKTLNKQRERVINMQITQSTRTGGNRRMRREKERESTSGQTISERHKWPASFDARQVNGKEHGNDEEDNEEKARCMLSLSFLGTILSCYHFINRS